MQYHNTVVVATRPMLLRDIALLRKGEPIPGTKKGMLSQYSDRCVKNACQLVFIVILLDSFEIINGLTGHDIYYGYCSAMILILRLLRAVDNDLTNDAKALALEERTQRAYRLLVLKIQGVINKTPMGGSMKRFAKVVDAFSECIKTPDPGLHSSTSNPGYPIMQQQQQQPLGYVNQAYIPTGGNFGQMMPTAQPQFTDLSAFGDVTPAGMVGGVFPMSTFGSPGMNEGLVTQFPSMEDVTIPGWLDMELTGLGGGYGGLQG